MLSMPPSQVVLCCAVVHCGRVLRSNKALMVCLYRLHRTLFLARTDNTPPFLGSFVIYISKNYVEPTQADHLLLIARLIHRQDLIRYVPGGQNITKGGRDLDVLRTRVPHMHVHPWSRKAVSVPGHYFDRHCCARKIFLALLVHRHG